MVSEVDLYLLNSVVNGRTVLKAVVKQNNANLI